MKIFTLAVMMAMTISANAMSYNAAKHEALFLSDKMAYELNLTDAQYDAVYEINLDYLMSVNIQNGINHRSDFILSTPNGVEVCHFTGSLILYMDYRLLPYWMGCRE